MKLRYIALAAALATQAAPSFAAATASASITNLQFTLVPDVDGDPAILTWSPSLQGYNAVYASDNNGTSPSYYSQPGAVSDSLSAIASAGTQASVASIWSANPTSVSGNGSATASSYSYFGFSSYPANWSNQFTLSAHTSLYVTGTFNVSTTADLAGYDLSQPAYESANASVYANIGGPSSFGGSSGNQSSYDQLVVSSYANSTTNSSGPQNGSRSFSLQFFNDTDNDLAGGIYLSVNGSGNSYGTLAPVPEPETYAMMLAGLATLGVMARRRQRG